MWSSRVQKIPDSLSCKHLVNNVVNVFVSVVKAFLPICKGSHWTRLVNLKSHWSGSGSRMKLCVSHLCQPTCAKSILAMTQSINGISQMFNSCYHPSWATSTLFVKIDALGRLFERFFLRSYNPAAAPYNVSTQTNNLQWFSTMFQTLLLSFQHKTLNHQISKQQISNRQKQITNYQRYKYLI